MSLAVNINHISKSFGKVKALNNVSFSVKPNDIFGLIGPDGAGKTTMFRILASLLKPEKGTARMGDFDTYKDYKEIRKITGYMPGQFSLYYDLTVEENLSFYSSIFKTSIQENYDLVREIYSQIEPFRKRLAGKLSGGMKQKLALSCALIHKPKVLLLDEPTTGVDVVSRTEFWQLLKKLQKKNITIIVSTPYMDEAGLCDTIALIQNGEILEVDSPTSIENRFPYSLFEISIDDGNTYRDKLQLTPEFISMYRFGDVFHLSLKQTQDRDDAAEKMLEKAFPELKYKKIRAEIEDCFLLMGK